MLKNSRVQTDWLAWVVGLVSVALLSSSPCLHAQDADDPPGRVARLAYLEGSVSFQPAGESEWVEAVPNRPMTTGDKLWADRDSRAEVQLGSATLDLAPNTGFSFLNLDDRTIQIQLSAGSLNVRLWDLDRDNVFEIDTPNQAFTAFQPGRYRVDASENGDYTVVTIRQGEGESTGNGQSYTMHSGQRFTLNGTTSLNAEVDQISGPDDFDNWSSRRQARYETSASARYCSRRAVGFEDLDQYGDWRPDPNYGSVWFPRVDVGWAPYHDGHWAWVEPWGWTWVDDDPWGYAPFHYGRWASFDGRWGWVPGPREDRPVYAPALVAFVGGGVAVGATIAWFPLGPREVYVPAYHVSPAYVNRVNITNTTVNQTTITNVYNTTIVRNNTTINNVTYVNRNVRGGVTAVPQQAFATAQPVARSAVAVNPQQLARGAVLTRAAVPPAQQAVLGVHANAANRVAAPPAAVVSRPVIAKSTPPPAQPSFSARQQILEQRPGVPLARPELAKLRTTIRPGAPVVKQAPPGRPATPVTATNRPAAPGGVTARPGNPQPGNQPAPNNRTQPTPPPARSEQPPSTAPNYRPEPNPRTTNQPTPNRTEPTPAEPGHPTPPPSRADRPPSSEPNSRPQPTPNNRVEPNRPTAPEERTNRPPSPPVEPGRSTPPPSRADRPPSSEPNYRPQPTPNNRVEPNRPTAPEERTNRPPSPPPNRQETAPPANHRPEPPRTEPNRPELPPSRADRPPSAQQQRPEPKQAPERKKQDNKPD